MPLVFLVFRQSLFAKNHWLKASNSHFTVLYLLYISGKQYMTVVSSAKDNNFNIVDLGM